MDVCYDVHIMNPNIDIEKFQAGTSQQEPASRELNFDVISEIMKHTDEVTKTLVGCTCTNMKVHTVSHYDAYTYLTKQLRAELPNDTDAKIVVYHNAPDSFISDTVISISSSGIWMSPDIKIYLKNWATSKNVISYRIRGKKENINFEKIKLIFSKILTLKPENIAKHVVVEVAEAEAEEVEVEVAEAAAAAPSLSHIAAAHMATIDSGFYLPTSIVQSMMKTGGTAPIIVMIRQNNKANANYIKMMNMIGYDPDRAPLPLRAPADPQAGGAKPKMKTTQDRVKEKLKSKLGGAPTPPYPLG